MCMHYVDEQVLHCVYSLISYPPPPPNNNNNNLKKIWEKKILAIIIYTFSQKLADKFSQNEQ